MENQLLSSWVTSTSPDPSPYVVQLLILNYADSNIISVHTLLTVYIRCVENENWKQQHNNQWYYNLQRNTKLQINQEL